MAISPTAHANDWIYTVRPGDTLWHVSERYLKDVSYYRRIQNHNNIQSPQDLDPGTQLRIPIAWLKLEPVPVKVLHVRGQVEVIRASDGKSHTLSAGDTLQIGDQIQTGHDSSASVQFADGSRLVAHSNSQLSFDTLKVYGRTGMVDTRLRLQRGNVENKVQPLRGPASRYEINTPAAVTAVRGTQFRIYAEQDRPVMRTEVEDGQVTVSGAGTTRVVSAGYGTIAEAGKPPEPPRVLLPAPDLSDLPIRIARWPVRFIWPSVENARAYRVQVWSDNEYSALLADATTTNPAYQLSRLPAGRYDLRVRAIDEFGLEGQSTEHRFTVESYAKPPKLVQPGNGEKLSETRPKFQWENTEDAHACHIQLAKDPYFQNILITQDLLTTDTYEPGFDLSAGKYYWRVATRNPQGKLGPFTKTHAFAIELAQAKKTSERADVTALLPPTLQPPRVYEYRLDFEWKEPFFNEDRHKYQFQIAYDPDFNHLLVDTQTSERRLSLPLPTPGRYHYRLRGFDAEDRPGVFSAIHWIDIPLINRTPGVPNLPPALR